MSQELSDDSYIPRFPNREMNKKPKKPLTPQEMDLYLGNPFSDMDSLSCMKKVREVVFRSYVDKKSVKKKDSKEIHSVHIDAYYGFLKDVSLYNSCFVTYLITRKRLNFNYNILKLIAPKITDEKYLQLTDEAFYKKSFDILIRGFNRLKKSDQNDLLEDSLKNQENENQDPNFMIDSLLNDMHHDKKEYLSFYRKALEFCSIKVKSISLNKTVNRMPKFDYEYMNSYVYLIDKSNVFERYNLVLPQADDILKMVESRVFNDKCELIYDGTLRKYGYNAYQRRFGSSGSRYYGVSYEDDSDIRQEAEEFLKIIFKKFDKTKFLKIIVKNSEESKEGKSEPKTLHWILRSFISMRVKWSAQETETWFKTTGKKKGSTVHNVYEESHEGSFTKYNYENEASGYYFEELEKMTPKKRKFVKEILEVGTSTSVLKTKYGESFDDLHKFYLNFKKKMTQKYEEVYYGDRGREVFLDQDEERDFPEEIRDFFLKNENNLIASEFLENVKVSEKRIKEELSKLSKSQVKKKSDLEIDVKNLSNLKELIKEYNSFNLSSSKISEHKDLYPLLEFAFKAMKIKKTDTFSSLLNIKITQFEKNTKANKTIVNALKKDNKELFEDLGETKAISEICHEYLTHIQSELKELEKKYFLKFLIDKNQVNILEKIIKGRNCISNIINMKNNNGNMIHYLVSLQSFELVNILLDSKRLEIDCQNDKGETPLHIAVKLGNEDISRKVLSKGANPSIMDNNDKFAFDYKK